MGKGQITVYVILAVILLFGLLMYITVNMEKDFKSTHEIVMQIKDVHSVEAFAQACVEKVAQDSLVYFGAVGGEFERYFMYGESYKIPYYYYNGHVYIPPLESVEQDYLAKFIDENLKSCTRGFANDAGFEVTEGDVASLVAISNDSIAFEVNYPIDVVRGDEQASFDRFTFVLPSRFSKMYQTAIDTVGLAQLDEQTIYWDYMTDITRYGFNLTVHPERGSTLIYRMVDPYSEVHKKPFVYQWAMKVEVEWVGV